jgi:hypothetical protein
MDRFHAIPDAPRFAGSWAEWLYFNGRAGDTRFYLTFLVGDRTKSGRRAAWVRLQLERDGVRSDWSARADLDEAALLDRAPDLEIAGNRVVLDGLSYRIHLDLASETGSSGSTVTGDLILEAPPGRSLPPFTVRGADGWQSGYVVPVLAGGLEGALVIDETRLSLEDGSGYHDHNWGFWEGVSWQWGQVHGDELSFVYGRLLPPADVVDRDRLPGLLVALGPEGPLAFSADVSIDEVDESGGGRPRSIHVRGRGTAIDIEMELEVHGAIGTRIERGLPASLGAASLDFLQLQATYHVSGQVDGSDVAFSAPGSAETFRGHGSRR